MNDTQTTHRLGICGRSAFRKGDRVMSIARDERLFEARYDIATAARLIHMNPSTLRNWAHGTRGFQSVLELPQRGFLSFINLTEAYVLYAMRRRYEIALPRVRTAIDYVEQQMGVEHPLAFQQFTTDKVCLLYTSPS